MLLFNLMFLVLGRCFMVFKNDVFNQVINEKTGLL